MQNNKPWGMEENTFIMLMHLSQLTTLIIPVLGIILPIVMWATNKDLSKQIEEHGKIIFNWMLSAFIYALICGVLSFIGIGILGLIALGIVNIIFVVMAAVKANKGELWAYPLSIKFFKLD